MNILFNKKEIKRNIKFLKEIDTLDLEGKIKYFEKTINHQRTKDKNMNLEKFIELIKNTSFFIQDYLLVKIN
ncbi:hypothetical protein GW931_02365 [archaeon]|nr:hypothetical protein [archaeon]PJC45643.1 MAG: hypothetical protein CO037_00465 [Candidatus Pacearchaeota archaeon CG_4_9_14_0_2_um_filter_30_8]